MGVEGAHVERKSGHPPLWLSLSKSERAVDAPLRTPFSKRASTLITDEAQPFTARAEGTYTSGEKYHEVSMSVTEETVLSRSEDRTLDGPNSRQSFR